MNPEVKWRRAFWRSGLPVPTNLSGSSPRTDVAVTVIPYPPHHHHNRYHNDLHLLSFIHSFIPSFVRSFVPAFLRSFVPAFLRSCVPSFLPSCVPSFLRSCVPSFLRSFVPSFLRSFLPSFLRSFLSSFLPSFLPSFLHSFVPSFLRSFLRSFVPSFLRSFVPSFLRSFVPSFITHIHSPCVTQIHPLRCMYHVSSISRVRYNLSFITNHAISIIHYCSPPFLKSSFMTIYCHLSSPSIIHYYIYPYSIFNLFHYLAYVFFFWIFLKCHHCPIFSSWLMADHSV